jgi:membrane-bound lytic murein transglycosylase MltF
MERLERQQKEMHDQYNQENQEFKEEEYVRKLRQGSMLKYGMSQGESLSKYYPRLRAHVDISAEKNIRTHVKNNGRGCWFTHKDKFGVGCFMCEDLNLIHYLASIVGYMARKYPEEKINF